ncbi:laminin alpha, partial [Aphelenchoides avenae]
DKARLHAHVAELEAKAKRLQDIYNRVVSTTENTVLASSVYKDVVEIIAQARNKTNIALIEAKRNSQHCAARSRRRFVPTFDAANRDVKDAIDVQAARIHEKLNSVQSEIDRLNGELESFNATRGRPDVAELDQVTSTSDAALARVETINNDNILNEALAASERVKKLSDVHSSVNQDTTSAQSQIKEIQEKLPATISSVTDLKARIDNTTAVVEELKGKLAYLKEKVAVARDKANRIKLGAHFEVGSVLELPVTAPVDDFGSYTDARLFFRTRRDTGLLLYFGNEARQSGVNEFIAVEVENRRPKLTFALGGKEPASITLDTEVTDHLWREIVVERVGKDATFKLTHPNSERFAEERTVSVSGSKNVLNLYKDSMRLLLPSGVNQRHFVGDLDKLQVNGEHIGFWNSDKAEHITGADVRTVADSERQAESGVSFNGNGYMQLGVGAWNPRKRTAILLSFSTYTPVGLLFFMGKDRDQLVVELVDGRVSLSFDLGSGAVKLLSDKSSYNDGQWHMISIDRMERRAKLEVDGADVQEGESPGTMFEMSVSDAFYLGGLPKNVQTRFTVQPFRGCLKNLKLDTEYINLNNARYSKGVQSSCPTREVRLATLISERSQATLSKLSATKDVELSLRFRTQQSTAHVASVTSNEEELLKIELDNGVLVVKSNGEEADVVRAEVPSGTEGRWHFISV